MWSDQYIYVVSDNCTFSLFASRTPIPLRVRHAHQSASQPYSFTQHGITALDLSYCEKWFKQVSTIFMLKHPRTLAGQTRVIKRAVALSNTMNTYTEYERLPEEMYSLRDFNKRAYDLMDEKLDPWEFILFVLTGEVPGEHQAHVNPILNELEPDHPISVSRDFDCIFGATQNIPVDCPVRMYLTSHPGDAVATSIHVDYFVRAQSCWFQSTEVTAYRQAYMNQRLTQALASPTIKYPTLCLAFGGMNQTVQVWAPSTCFFPAWDQIRHGPLTFLKTR